MAAKEVSHRVSPIFKQYFLLTRVLDCNKTFASRLHPEASSNNYASVNTKYSEKNFEGLNLHQLSLPPRPSSSSPILVMQTKQVHPFLKFGEKAYCSGSSPEFEHRPSSAQLSLIFQHLQDELPQFFEGIFSPDMYEKKMRFINSLYPVSFTLRSRDTYALYLRFHRSLARALYYDNSFDILKITKDDESGEIQVRWMVQGTPRLIPWLSQRVLLNGFSTFIVNNQGKISIHKLDKVIPSPKEMYGTSSVFVQIGLMLGLIRRKNTNPLHHPQAQNNICNYNNLLIKKG